MLRFAREFNLVTKPLVSILMPCFNAESYVGAAIESVLAQTYRHIELIVVNDGSTDGSAAVLEPFGQRGVTIIHQPNAGQCAAANRALAAAQGDYIKFFDADDLLAPDMIEKQVAALNGSTDCIAFGEWSRFQGEPGEATFPRLEMYRDADPIDWLASEWAGGAPMTQCAMFLIPRRVLLETGGWDERLSLINDFEFFARVLLKARWLRFVPNARLYYRSGLAGSLSRQKSRKAAESAALSLLTGTGHLLAAEDSARTRRACANVLMTFEYGFYPEFPDLRAKIRARVVELGGATLPPDGPPRFHTLRKFIGWRAARRVQHLAERLGLNGAARSGVTAL